MVQDYSAFRPSRIWKRLPPARRAELAELFWNDEQSAEQQVEACAAIAGHMKFRPKTVLALPVEKKVHYLTRLPNVPDTVAARALVSYHLERQRGMMSDFLDSLGIAHDSGLINDDEVVKPEGAALQESAAALVGRYPAEDVSLYFCTLVSQDPDTWGGLADLPQTSPPQEAPA